MHQLKLAYDRDTQLINELLDAVHSTTLSQAAKASEARRILMQIGIDLDDRSTNRSWSATELAQELGVSAVAIGRLANAHQLKVVEYGEFRIDQAAHSRKQVETFHYNQAGRQRLAELINQRTANAKPEHRHGAPELGTTRSAVRDDRLHRESHQGKGQTGPAD